ncbi:hypothetical protein [Campylobacter troglodytis]|uniref:hypothetical protein n=1 Tax=Campylobacter troglodytis TaxID=654363 RepID=UPI0011578448|nr:hypothetical protein [Campylobacter troglodytis]TQR60515.1 hypothetical protein DMC01_05490 [Campylobacter troglodytis]
MVLKFDFIYTSDNDFFEYLLKFYARKLIFATQKDQNRLSLVVKGGEEEIKAFCDSLEALPNSSFVRHFNVEVLENEELRQEEAQKSFDKKDFLTHLNVKAYQEKGVLIENEWGEFVCESLSFDNGLSFSPINMDNFNALLNQSLDLLNNGRSFLIKNELGICEVGLLSMQKDFLNLQENSSQEARIQANSAPQSGTQENSSPQNDTQQNSSSQSDMQTNSSQALARQTKELKTIQLEANLASKEMTQENSAPQSDTTKNNTKENSRQNSILPPNSQEKFLMATEIKALKTAFVCSNDNLKLLASLEKPLIKLRFSAIFRQNRGLKINEFKVKLPHNLFFFALGARLFERGENFLAFTKRENSGDEFELYECEKRLVVLRGLSFINKRARELILSKDDKNMARISYILSRFEKSALLLELSQSYDDILLIDKERNMLNLSLPRSAGQIYADICADEVGKRLFDNFKLNFQLLSGEFELKNNFFSLLGLVGLTLGLGKTVQTAALRVLELSDATKIPRGVKIDYRYKENSKEFDYTRTLRSAMSFMLAGVEAENIAYGAVESLSFFLRDFYDELREKKLVEIAIISGSLFESKALTKNTLKHLKDCKVSDVPLWI